MGDDHNQRPNWPSDRQEYAAYTEFSPSGTAVALGSRTSPTFSASSTFAPPSLCPSPNNSCTNNGVNAPKYGTLVPNRIFVGGLELSTTDDELSNLFCGYGLIKSAKVIVDRAGVSKGYGFVTFVAEDDAKKLMMNSDHVQLNGRRLNIAPAIKKQGFVSGSRSFENVPAQTGVYTQQGPVYFGSSIPPYPYGNPYSVYVQQPQQMHPAESNTSVYQSPYLNTGPGISHNSAANSYQLIYQPPPPPSGSQTMYMAHQGAPYQQYQPQMNPASTWVDPGMSTHYQISPSLPYLVPMY